MHAAENNNKQEQNKKKHDVDVTLCKLMTFGHRCFVSVHRVAATFTNTNN